VHPAHAPALTAEHLMAEVMLEMIGRKQRLDRRVLPAPSRF
jgi:hypothetical protein